VGVITTKWGDNDKSGGKNGQNCGDKGY